MEAVGGVFLREIERLSSLSRNGGGYRGQKACDAKSPREVHAQIIGDRIFIAGMSGGACLRNADGARGVEERTEIKIEMERSVVPEIERGG